jgi:hypothetical protein
MQFESNKFNVHYRTSHQIRCKVKFNTHPFELGIKLGTCHPLVKRDSDLFYLARVESQRKCQYWMKLLLFKNILVKKSQINHKLTLKKILTMCRFKLFKSLRHGVGKGHKRDQSFLCRKSKMNVKWT